jgi:hypothetical protein
VLDPSAGPLLFMSEHERTMHRGAQSISGSKRKFEDKAVLLQLHCFRLDQFVMLFPLCNKFASRQAILKFDEDKHIDKLLQTLVTQWITTCRRLEECESSKSATVSRVGMSTVSLGPYPNEIPPPDEFELSTCHFSVLYT